jgi:hypothetical protein
MRRTRPSLRTHRDKIADDRARALTRVVVAGYTPMALWPAGISFEETRLSMPQAFAEVFVLKV